MKKRPLGKSGITVAPLTFGGNVFGWTIDEKTSFELLDAFVAAGFDLIDTADVYSRWKPGNSGGESETIIGNWMAKRSNRSKVIIATKVGADMGQGKKDLSKKYILKAVEDSLQRLKTDYIDLYQTHFDDDGTPVEETMEVYSLLIKEGKVRAIGASNLSPVRFKASLEVSKKFGYPAYQTFQPEYNLFERAGFEQAFAPLCLENGIGVINYFSLAAGFLTGKYRSESDLTKSLRGQGIKKYLNERGFRILKALDEVSTQYSTTQSSVAIAWLLARPSITAPIASATSLVQLEALIQSTELHLDDDVMTQLNNASAY